MTPTADREAVRRDRRDRLPRPAVLAAIGAGDLAVERAKTVLGQFRLQGRGAAGRGPGPGRPGRQGGPHPGHRGRRHRPHHGPPARRRRPSRGAAQHRRRPGRDRPHPGVATVEKLAEHGAEVVEDLRRQPAFRRVVRRAERAVDAVEDTLEDVLEETAETVVEASNKATSVAQKTAAKASKVAAKAEDKVEDAAETTKATAEKAVEAPNSGAKPVTAKSTTVKAAAPGQEDHPGRPQVLAGQGHLGPRDPRPHRQAGRPDRGARQEELTSPTSDHRPGPRSCDAALRGPVASVAGDRPFGVPRRDRPAVLPGSRGAAGTLAPWVSSSSGCSPPSTRRPGADPVGLRRRPDPSRAAGSWPPGKLTKPGWAAITGIAAGVVFWFSADELPRAARRHRGGRVPGRRPSGRARTAPRQQLVS